MQNNKLALVIPLVGFLFVILWIIAIFVSYEPEKPKTTTTTIVRSTSTIQTPPALKLGTIKKTYGRVIVDSKYFDPLTMPIKNAVLMNDKGTILSLNSILNDTEEASSTYSYLPETKSLIEHIGDKDYAVEIDKENNILLHKERNSNRILIGTENHKTILDEHGLPLRFTLLKQQ